MSRQWLSCLSMRRRFLRLSLPAWWCEYFCNAAHTPNTYYGNACYNTRDRDRATTTQVFCLIHKMDLLPDDQQELIFGGVALPLTY